MNQENKIHIEFGIPKDGWLPVFFTHIHYKLELNISNVPLDPMNQLCNSLIQINKGIKNPDRIIWNMEPYCYFLKLERIDKHFKVTILESNDFDKPAKLAKEISGSFEEIILPLFRGLKKFWSQSFNHPNWEELDSKRIEELTKIIRKRK